MIVINSPSRYWSHSEFKLNIRLTTIDLDRLIYPGIEHLSGFHVDVTLLLSAIK